MKVLSLGFRVRVKGLGFRGKHKALCIGLGANSEFFLTTHRMSLYLLGICGSTVSLYINIKLGIDISSVHDLPI